MADGSEIGLELDVQDGCLRRTGHEPLALSDRQLALLYWQSLAAPLDRAARAIGVDETLLDADLAKLADSGIDSHRLARLQFSVGQAPRSTTRWSDRHALTILRTGFDRADEDPFMHVSGDGQLSLAEVRGLVEQTASALLEAGIEQGDIVAIDTQMRLESWLAATAALLIGAVVSRLDTHSGGNRLRRMLELVPARLTLTSRTGDLAGMDAAGRVISLSQTDIETDFESWLMTAPSRPEDLWNRARVKPTDTALIGFTSGSTGQPKGVFATHEAIFRTSEAGIKRLGFGEDETYCTATDFTSTNAFRCMLTYPLMTRGRVVLPGQAAAEHALALAVDCAEAGVTRLFAIPNVQRGWLRDADRIPKGGLDQLKSVVSIAGVLDPTTATRFREQFNVGVHDAYGSREANMMLYSDDPSYGSLGAGGGTPAEVLIRILNDDGRPAGRGEIGEIGVHTDCMMAGYAGDIEHGIEMDGIWHRTGDLGRIMPDGHIEIVGRKRDIIKTPEAVFIAPAEIEAILNALDDVVEASVFKWVDTDGGERVGAALRLTEMDQDRTSLLRQARQSVRDQAGRFKVPHRFLILDEFPRAGRDKPDKHALGQLIQQAAATSSTDGRLPHGPAGEDELSARP